MKWFNSRYNAYFVWAVTRSITVRWVFVFLCILACSVLSFYFLELCKVYIGWRIVSNLFGYLSFVVFQVITYMFTYLYWIFVDVPYVLFIGWFYCISVFGFLSTVFKLFLSLFVFSIFIVGRLCLSVMDCFLDFLRILGAFGLYSISPYQVGEGKRVGLQFTSIFFFRPFLVSSLTETGFFLGFPEAIEVFAFQVVYSIYQIVWLGLFFFVYIGWFALNFGFTICIIFMFMSLDLVHFIWIYLFSFLSGSLFIQVGLIIIFFVGLLCFSTWFKNFCNLQVVFSFIIPNRWFGLNFAPGFSISQVLVSSLQARVAFVRSGLWRIEGLIFFTSHLRLDPKTMDMPLW